MKLFESYFKRQKFKNIVTKVNEYIYSERFEMKNLLQAITTNFRDDEMLRAYVAIEVATKLTEPLSKQDIDYALEVIASAEQVSYDSEQFKDILQIHKISAENNWKEKTELIQKGKQSRKKDKYSYEGAIYDLEKTKKAPSTSKERQKWKALSIDYIEKEQRFKVVEKEYNEAVKKLREDYEEQESTIKAEAALQRIKAEVEEEKKLNGEKSEDQILKEREGILEDIKGKLRKIRDDNNSDKI